MAIFHALVVLSIWLMLGGAAAGNIRISAVGATSFIVLAAVAAYVDDTKLTPEEMEEWQ